MSEIFYAIAGRRARQQVIENKENETIDVNSEGYSAVLITGCRNCTINAVRKTSKVTIERCTETSLRVGVVVAVLEVIHCTGVRINMRRSITIDVSAGVSLSTACLLPEVEDALDGGVSVGDTPRSPAAEVEAVRLYTSRSNEVSIALDCVDLPGTILRVPADRQHERGDGPRSVSRMSTHVTPGSRTVSLKTRECDQYGTPIEKVEAIAAGVPWTWENGSTGDSH